MIKKIVLLMLLLVMMAPVTVRAAGFNLRSIGAVSTEGKQVSHWWYTASQPTLKGEASPGTDVTVTIDDQPMVVSADSAGEWVFTPSSGLVSGDHSVGLTNSGSQINFILTIGSENVNWDAVEKGTGEAMPAAGVAWPTVVLLIGGLGVVGLGGKMVVNVNKK